MGGLLHLVEQGGAWAGCGPTQSPHSVCVQNYCKNPQHFGTDIRVINRFFMKLFKTSNIRIVQLCQELFHFELPSVQLARRRKVF